MFILCTLFGMLVSILEKKGDHPDAIDYASVDTRTTAGFNWASLGVILMLTGLYTVWW